MKMKNQPVTEASVRNVDYKGILTARYIHPQTLLHQAERHKLFLTSFARSPSMLKSSRGFTVASFIDKNCNNKESTVILYHLSII